MTLDDNFPPRRNVKLAVAVSLVLHIAAVYFWRIMTAHPHMAEVPVSWITVRLMPLQALPKPEEKTMPRKEEPQRDRARKEASRPIEPKAVHEQTAESTPAKPQKPASPVESATPMQDAPAAPIDMEELNSSLRRDIGRIDRELRKEHPNLPGAKPGSSETKLARDIAAAGKGGALSGVQVSEISFPDGTGRRMYKVSFPGGHYCVTYESVGRRDGYDPSQIASFHKAKVTTCPGDLSR
jgi:hypothetical protein